MPLDVTGEPQTHVQNYTPCPPRHESAVRRIPAAQSRGEGTDTSRASPGLVDSASKVPLPQGVCPFTPSPKSLTVTPCCSILHCWKGHPPKGGSDVSLPRSGLKIG